MRPLPLLALACVALVDCGAPPWQLGKPLDGRPSIPPGSALATPAELTAEAEQERVAGRRVLEIAALQKLDVAEQLTGPARARLVELLAARATEFHALGRAIPESADLETIARLDAARGAQLVPARAVAATAAGNAWKAIGARDEARAAHARAAALGGVRPGDVGIMPRRAAVSPHYFGRGEGGGPHPPPPEPSRDGSRRASSPASDAKSAAGKPPADVDGYVFGGATLSARLLPLVAAFPWLLDHQTRALAWAELLLAEDPTSPEVLELVAVIFGRAGRFGGTERMLMELAYHSSDRATGIARGAVVWERLGRTREACAQWIRAARWRDDPEDPRWRKAFACARRDPGAGDADAIRNYVVGRARPERREALAAELEGRPPPVDGGVPDGSARDGAGQER